MRTGTDATLAAIVEVKLGNYGGEKTMTRVYSQFACFARVVSTTLAVFGLALLGVIGASAGSIEKVLYTFSGTGLDGGYPSGLISDVSGNLYGATAVGGIYGKGTVFELSPVGGGWSETILYSFGTNPNDGYQGIGALVFDKAGNLYGTTYYGGGSENCGFGCGTVYMLSPGPNGWTESVLHAFSAGDGEGPASQLTLDSAGNLYGTTRDGGAHGCGTVFEMSPSGGIWTESVLHSFSGGTDGDDPVHAGLAIDAAENLYGTTFYGGASGAGQVFELTFTAGKWKKKVLHSFVNGKGIGGYPEGGVTLDATGNLFGTTTQAGAAGKGGGGGVFELKLVAGGKRAYEILHEFNGGTDGDFASGGVIFDTLGNLYSTTNEGGGANNYGTVFELTPLAKVPWKETILYGFEGGSDGINPNTTPLAIDGEGNLYGSTNAGGDGYGVIFEVSH
jgi:uncharacterized repeat protein (TIGR03803 family)